MPVYFKNSTEYMQKYGSVEAQGAEMGHGAGVASDKNALTQEPSLQHKKRLDGPPSSLSTDYFEVPSRAPEYALLGQQEKFASNVKYQPRKSGSDIYKNKENFYDASPPSKQLKMQKRIKPLIKERHPPISRSPPRQSSSKVTPQSPPPAPRGHTDNVELKEALKDKDLKDVLGEKPQGAQKSRERRDVREEKAKGPLAVSQSQEPLSLKLQNKEQQQEVSNMNEFVQTNMKKGVAMSAPEAPAEYALKYKAGVAPPRPIRKFSEYQKQFQWKDGMKASPLLAAEELVYKSHADLGPYKTDGVPKVSEYARQFQAWKPLVDPVNVNFNVNNNNNNNNRNNVSQDESVKMGRKKKSKAKRSKSAGAVLRHDESADLENEEGADESNADEMKAKLKEKHGKIRRVVTEYRSNYKPPTRYSYEKGAWKGAYPPHLMYQVTSDEDALNKNNNQNNNRDDAEPLSNWFAEVIELRRRAQEYRKRAQGTHFSREHLVQLIAKQTDCWDLNSEASSTIKALNLEAPAMQDKMIWEEPLKPVELCSHEATEGDSPVLTDVDEGEQERQKEGGKRKKGGKKRGRKGGDKRSRKMAWLEEQKEKVAEQRRKLEEERQRMEDANDDDGGVENGDNEREGRLPTPLIQQTKTSVRRHHLDLTTPSVGGAILTCPPSKDSKMIVTSRSGDSYVTASDDCPAKSQTKKYNVDHLVTMPILGQPSPDTHPLRDDSADSDRALKSQYLASPPLLADDEDKENAKKPRQSKRKGKMPKPSNLTTVQEGYGKTYHKSKPYVSLADIKADLGPKDDDVMSVSLMSVASSSTLASDTLERAKRRQDFWNNQGSCC